MFHFDWATMGEVAVLGLVALGIIKRSTLEVLSIANKSLEQNNKQLLVQLTTMQSKHETNIRKLNNELSTQGKKILLIEFNDEAKTKMLSSRAHEIDMLESGLDMAIQILVKLNAPEADVLTMHLAKLRAYRSKSRDEYTTWETVHKAAVEKLTNALVLSITDDAKADDAEETIMNFLKGDNSK